MSIFPVESQILCTFKKEKKSYFTLQFGNIRMNIRCIRKFYCFSFECSLNLPLTDTGHNILKGYELSFSCQNPRQTGNTPQHSTETPHLTNIASYHCPTPRDVLIQQGYLSAWRSRCHVQVGNGGGMSFLFLMTRATWLLLAALWSSTTAWKLFSECGKRNANNTTKEKGRSRHSCSKPLYISRQGQNNLGKCKDTNTKRLEGGETCFCPEVKSSSSQKRNSGKSLISMTRDVKTVTKNFQRQKEQIWTATSLCFLCSSVNFGRVFFSQMSLNKE